MARIGSKILQGIGIGLLCAVAMMLLYARGWLEPAELKSLDYRFRSVPPSVSTNTSDRIVIIDIGDSSLSHMWNNYRIRWPWPRQVYGDMLVYLKHLGAEAVVFDIWFYEPDIQRVDLDGAESDQRLVDGTAEHGNVFHAFLLKRDSLPLNDQDERVAAINSKYEGVSAYVPSFCDIPEYSHGEPPSAALSAASRHLGFVNVLSERDEEDTVHHKAPTFASYHRRLVLSLPMVAAWDLCGRPALAADNDVLKFGEYEIPVDSELQSYIWWYHMKGVDPFRRIEAFPVIRDMAAWMSGSSEAVPGKEALSADVFKDKIVLIGSSSSGLHDIMSTPVDKTVPGVVVQATTLQNILSGDFVRRWPMRATGVAVFAFCVLIGAVSRTPRRVTIPVLCLLVATGTITWLGYRELAENHIFVDIVPPLLGGFVTFTISLAANVLSERRHSKHVRGMFQHYVDKSVVNELIAHPESLALGGEERYCTVLFADVAGFTSMSELMTPEQVVRVMNIYLGAMTDIVVSENGFVDRYVADEIVSAFGVPAHSDDHAVRACRAALRMEEECDRIQGELLEAGAPGRVFARMGINTGDMLVGNIGSGARRNYTLMGDAANVGARVMGANKLYGTTLLVTQSVCDSVEGQFVLREVDSVRVVGKREAVVLYELVGESGTELPAGYSDYSAGLREYRVGNWKTAAAAFGRGSELGDPASKEMVRRCEAYLKDPPSDWDGTWDMTSK